MFLRTAQLITLSDPYILLGIMNSQVLGHTLLLAPDYIIGTWISTSGDIKEHTALGRTPIKPCRLSPLLSDQSSDSLVSLLPLTALFTSSVGPESHGAKNSGNRSKQCLHVTARGTLTHQIGRLRYE